MHYWQDTVHRLLRRQPAAVHHPTSYLNDQQTPHHDDHISCNDAHSTGASSTGRSHTSSTCAALQVWLPTDKNMVGCDNCNFWVHDHCDPMAARVLALIERGDEEEAYMCPLCRKLEEGRQTLAALARAEAAMKHAQPRNPRSAYNLFSMEIHK